MRRLSFFSTSDETKAHLKDEHGIEYNFTDEEVAPRKRKTPKSGGLNNHMYNSNNCIIVFSYINELMCFYFCRYAYKTEQERG